MKLQYCSDLHLEFRENREFIKKNPLQVKGDILLLAGDITPFTTMDKHKVFFDFVSDNFQHAYWVPGNHEYYYSDAIHRSGSLNEKIRDNIFLVNNVSVEREKVKLIFSTLWSKISVAHEYQIEQSMSDFQVIKYNGYRFSSKEYNQLYQGCINFLRKEIALGTDCAKVVVSHHVPTFLHYPERYKGDVLNEAFAVELFDFIRLSDIRLWLYGHNHTNTPDFMIGNTLVATNQLGYVKYGEHGSFKNDKVFIIE
jgi:predicted phosphohydrolase